MEIAIICLLIVLSVLFLNIPAVLEKIVLRRRQKSYVLQREYYRNFIFRYIPFFHRLDDEQQEKFLLRTYLFHRSKRFHYVNVQPKPEMPVLISAVAVQLTLGLEKFTLNDFDDIFVLEHDYQYGEYALPFLGHVDRSGIYLSWDNFLAGLRYNPDSNNVGLHEMAHALAYVNFVTRTEEDKRFKKEFKNFSRVARPVFQEMQKGRKTLLGVYAATNYHEFWAVSVEMFFENPVRFKHELPEVYAAMAMLLNQDPIEQIKHKRTIIYRQVKARDQLTA